MIQKIKNIADVIPGYSFRGSILSDQTGNTYVLQAKNVKVNQPVTTTEELIKVTFPTIRSAAFLKKNDVILLSKGSGAGTFRACVYAADDNNIAASASVHIIRVTSPLILSDYLALYLNSKECQKAIDEVATGTHFQSLPSSLLKELEIPLPTLHEQQLLVKLYRNLKDQERINHRKSEIYDNLMNASMKHFFKSLYQ